MCDWRPGPRCAGDAAKDLARARADFEAKHPFDRLPDMLVDARTMAALDADFAVARAAVRAHDASIRAAEAGGADPGTIADLQARRDGALSQALAVREVVTGITEQRLATRAEHLAAHRPKVADPEPTPAVPAIPDGFDARGFDGIGRHYTGGWRDQDGFDVDGRDARGADRTGWLATGRHAETGTRFDPEGYGADGYHRRHGFDRLGYHRATGTQCDLEGRTLEDVEGAAAAAAPVEVASAEVQMAPAVKRLALYARWDRPDDLLTPAQVQDVLGVDAAGLAALDRSGRLPAAIDEGRDWPRMYRFDRVLEVAGPLPAPGAMTRVAAREHTMWKRSAERERIAAWRELEARKNRAARAA